MEKPERFTEKIQWRKLYENDPRISRCIDKLTFKQYVREKIGAGLSPYYPSEYELKMFNIVGLMDRNPDNIGKVIKLIWYHLTFMIPYT